MLHRSPRLSGLKRSRWWLEGIGQCVTWLKECSKAGICQILKRLGLSYKRGREYLHSPDPDYDLKMSYIKAAKAQAGRSDGQIILLYQDELTYYRRPSVARNYAPQGSKYPIAKQGLKGNNRRRISGALNALSGQVFAWQRSRFNRSALIRYYRAIEDAYPQAKTIYLVQDNWPVHFHPEILQALSSSKICLLRLPTYAPWTNPIEKLWLRLKQELLHQHDFEDDWQALQDAVQDWIDHCDDDTFDLLHYVGLFPY